jgi:hypothetical protein
VQPRAPAPGAAGQDVRVVEETIQQRGDGGGVAEELPPVFHGTVRCDQRRGALVAAHDDLEEILGRGVREPAHAEIVNEQEGTVVTCVR